MLFYMLTSAADSINLDSSFKKFIMAASFLARFSCAFALALPRTIARQGAGGEGEGAHGRAAQRRAARAQQAPSLSSCSRPPSLHLGCRECGATRRELVPVRRTGLDPGL